MLWLSQPHWHQHVLQWDAGPVNGFIHKNRRALKYDVSPLSVASYINKYTYGNGLQNKAISNREEEKDPWQCCWINLDDASKSGQLLPPSLRACPTATWGTATASPATMAAWRSASSVATGALVLPYPPFIRRAKDPKDGSCRMVWLYGITRLLLHCNNSCGVTTKKLWRSHEGAMKYLCLWRIPIGVEQVCCAAHMFGCTTLKLD